MAQGPTVTISLQAIRDNAIGVAKKTGVPVIAVVKANAYGLGAAVVARALAAVREVEGFYTFSLAEALAAELPATGKPTLAMEPHPRENVDDYVSNRVRPSVWTADVAAQLKLARPVFSLDTGMQRFAAGADQIDAIAKAGEITEFMTHGTRVEHAVALQQATRHLRHAKLHAAGSALLDEPRAYLDATRPGVALYSNAVTVTSPLVDARDSKGPIGYTGFVTPRHGVILGGYQHGVRRGPCLVNGRLSRLLEVGMQTSFVELEPSDKTGDPVILLSPELTPETVAQAWSSSPHEVLLRLSAFAPHTYVE